MSLRQIRKSARRGFYRAVHAVLPEAVRRPIRGLFPGRARRREQRQREKALAAQQRAEALAKRERAAQTKAELAALKRQKRG